MNGSSYWFVCVITIRQDWNENSSPVQRELGKTSGHLQGLQPSTLLLSSHYFILGPGLKKKAIHALKMPAKCGKKNCPYDKGLGLILLKSSSLCFAEAFVKIRQHQEFGFSCGLQALGRFLEHNLSLWE